MAQRNGCAVAVIEQRRKRNIREYPEFSGRHVLGLSQLNEPAFMSARILLNSQELEFALACRDFLGEKDWPASQRIQISQREMTVPDNGQLRQAFLAYGVARLMKVFHRAIENRATPLDQVGSPHALANNPAVPGPASARAQPRAGVIDLERDHLRDRALDPRRDHRRRCC
jgi:hypothetical protein